MAMKGAAEVMTNITGGHLPAGAHAVWGRDGGLGGPAGAAAGYGVGAPLFWGPGCISYYCLGSF